MIYTFNYEYIIILISIVFVFTILYLQYKYINSLNNISNILNNLIYTRRLINIELNNIINEINSLSSNNNKSSREKRLFRRNIMKLNTNYMNLKDKCDTLSYIIDDINKLVN